MSRFVDNYNAYISAKKIKKKYIGMVSGFDSSKLSRILKNDQSVTESEMNTLAEAVGKDIMFFLNQEFTLEEERQEQIPALLYAGNLDQKQIDFSKTLIDLLGNVDEILSAETRFHKAMEDGYGSSKI